MDFTTGKRFRKYKYIGMAVNGLIVFTFYFIYRYLFGDAFPVFTQPFMAYLFLALGVAVAYATRRAFDKYAAGIHYRVAPEGLIVQRGREENLYRWDCFCGVSFADGGFQNVFPVEFLVGEKKIMLNQHLDGLCQLTQEIFDHIDDHVDIPDALRKRAFDMLDVY